MKQKYVLGIVALSLFAILGVSMVSAFGFGNGFMNPPMADKGRTAMQEQQKAMQTAISNGDYATWKSLMEDQIAKMQSQITEENFNTIREQQQKMSEFRTAMQKARESGNFSKVEELQEKYKPEGNGFERGMKAGFRMDRGNCSCSE